jgi:hypothetical protein
MNFGAQSDCPRNLINITDKVKKTGRTTDFDIFYVKICHFGYRHQSIRGLSNGRDYNIRVSQNFLSTILDITQDPS